MAADIQPLAYWSRWKAAVLATAMTALAIGPNLPGFERGLTYTAFFFTQAGTPIHIFSSLVLGIIGLALASLAITANFRRLAVWIEEEDLYWRAVTVRKMPLANIKSVALTLPGLIQIERRDGGRPAVIAGFAHEVAI